MFATLHGNRMVRKGRKLGGTRIIPLTIAEKRIETVETICRDASPVVAVKPVRPHSVGIVTTGSEVYHGRIEDQFGPVLERKFKALGSTILR